MPEHLSADALDSAAGPKIDWSREELEARFPHNRLAELEASLVLPKFNALFELQEKNPGLELCLTGGILRDTLLGHEPKDYDWIVRFPEGTEDARQKFEDFFGPKTFTTPKDKQEDNWKRVGPGGTLVLKGKGFGVYKFTPTGEKEVLDIAFPRSEKPRAGGFGGAKEIEAQSDPTLPVEREVCRRDFTVNGLVLKTQRDASGQVNANLLDYVGGLDDLESGTLRAIGDPDARLNEDKSRVARALRFANKNGLQIAPDLATALRRQAEARVFEQKRPDGSLVVSRETLAVEFLKGFSADPVGYLQSLSDYGFLDSLLPDLTRYRAPERLPEKLNGKTEEQKELLLADSQNPADAAIRRQIFDDAKKALVWHREHFGVKSDANEQIFLLLHEIGKCAALQKANGNGKKTYDGYLDLSKLLVPRAVKELKLDSLTAEHFLRVQVPFLVAWLGRYETALSLFSPTMSKEPGDEAHDGALIARVKSAFPELSHDPLWRIIQAKFATGTDVWQGKDELPKVAKLLQNIEQQEPRAPAEFSALISGTKLLQQFLLPGGKDIGQILQSSWRRYCGMLVAEEYHTEAEWKRGMFAEVLRADRLSALWNKNLITEADAAAFALATGESDSKRAPRAVRRSLIRALEKLSAVNFLGEPLSTAAEQDRSVAAVLDARHKKERGETIPFEHLFARALATDPEKILDWLEKGFARDRSLPSLLFPELRRLPGTQQDQVFHSEGDAWVHTRKMFNAAKERGIEITPVLALTLLYHDVAKPLTASQAPDGRIHFLKHESLGADLLTQKVNRFDWDDQNGLSWPQVIAAIENHAARYTRWASRSPRLLELRRLMPEGRNSLLYQLIVCDLAAGVPFDPAERNRDKAFMKTLDEKLRLVERETGAPDIFDRLVGHPAVQELIGKNSRDERLEILYQKYLEKLPGSGEDIETLAEQIKVAALLADKRWLGEYVRTKLVPAKILLERGITGPDITMVHQATITQVTAALQRGERLDQLSTHVLLDAF